MAIYPVSHDLRNGLRPDFRSSRACRTQPPRHYRQWRPPPPPLCQQKCCLHALPAMETAASTEVPALLTSVPTDQGAIETLAAGQTGSSNCPSTPTAGGLGVSIDTAKAVLQITQQFAFADGSVGGQPAAIVTLTPSGASSFPAIAQGFTAQFIGDPCNLSRISITIPRTDQTGHCRSGYQCIEPCPDWHITHRCTTGVSYLGIAKLPGSPGVRPTADHHQDFPVQLTKKPDQHGPGYCPDEIRRKGNEQLPCTDRRPVKSLLRALSIIHFEE